MSGRNPPAVTVAAVIERAGRFLLVEEMADGRRVTWQSFRPANAAPGSPPTSPPGGAVPSPRI